MKYIHINNANPPPRNARVAFKIREDLRKLETGRSIHSRSRGGEEVGREEVENGTEGRVHEGEEEDGEDEEELKVDEDLDEEEGEVDFEEVENCLLRPDRVACCT